MIQPAGFTIIGGRDYNSSIHRFPFFLNMANPPAQPKMTSDLWAYFWSRASARVHGRGGCRHMLLRGGLPESDTGVWNQEPEHRGISFSIRE